MTRLAQVYKGLLKSLPADLRDRHGQEMERAFSAALADAQRRGRLSAVVAAAVMAADVVKYSTATASRGFAASLASWRTGRHEGTFAAETRAALRSFRFRPGWTCLAVMTLSLGIGVNSAIFSIVQAGLLRPLPYPAPDRLVEAWLEFRSERGSLEIPASEPEFLELRARSRSFQGLANYWTGRMNLGGASDPQRVRGAAVSANFLEVLGVPPTRGRGFVAGEDLPGNDGVAIISDGLWRRAFGADPQTLGRTVLVQSHPKTVIGILPRAFRFPGGDIELLIPNVIDPAAPGGRSSHYMSMVGRLRPDVGLDAALDELEALAVRWEEDFPGVHSPSARHPVVIGDLHRRIVGETQRPLLLLSAAAALVFLIACANVAGLNLSRTHSRRRELALRTALGAGSYRIMRQMLVESSIVAGLAGACGLVLAFAATAALRVLGPDASADWRIDAPVVAFTAVVSVVASGLVALPPAWRAMRGNLASLLAEEGSGLTLSVARQRFRRTLVTAELAVSVMLCIGAGVLVKSLMQLERTDPGFEPRGVLTFEVALDRAAYPEPHDVAAFHSLLEERLAGVPGIVAFGSVRALPLVEAPGFETMMLEGATGGRPADEDEPASRNAQYQVVGPQYFRALGVPLLAGRSLMATDVAEAPPVAVVNETMARLFWNGDALGRAVRLGMGPPGEQPSMRVVGIVGDVRQARLNEPHKPQVFAPLAQAGANHGGLGMRRVTAVLRAPDLDASTVSRTALAIVRATDPNLPIANVQTMEEVVAGSVSNQRVLARLISSFTLLALGLAAVGVYGLVAFGVAARTREIGLRMALGASRGAVLGFVLRQGLAVAAGGALLGTALGAGTTWTLTSLLHEVSPYDPGVLLAAPALLTVVALAATLLPATRASRLSPQIALRRD